MNILLTGATGLIGSALLNHLLALGHQVTALGRRVPADSRPGVRWVAIDMVAMQQAADWRPLLAGQSVVINTVGVLREAGAQTFAALHERAPVALFQACPEAGVTRVIQLSALGAAEDAATGYWRSKARADAVLMTLPLDWTVVRPSLVYADAGASSQLFLKLAALPVLAVPADAGCVQPLHLDDLTALLAQLVSEGSGGRVIDAVGPQALPWGQYLQALRQGLGMAPAFTLTIPAPLTTIGVRLAGALPGSLVQSDSLTMLRRGNQADAAPLRARLGRPLRQPATFALPSSRAATVLAAWSPLLRLALAFVWLFTAWVSVVNQAEGIRLLASAGLPAALHPAALWSGALLDALLGLLTLFRPSRRLWQGQLLLVLAYTLFITLQLGDWWWHPFGPISKNLPILALLGLLAALAPASPQRTRVQ
ncbi:SDR family oxidoreductase [Chitinimonas naiadis]